MARSADLYQTLVAEYPVQAPYAVALAYRIHYVMQMKPARPCTSSSCARGPRATLPTVGSPSPCTGDRRRRRAPSDRRAMVHVDHGSTDLERLDAERRAEARRAARQS